MLATRVTQVLRFGTDRYLCFDAARFMEYGLSICLVGNHMQGRSSCPPLSLRTLLSVRIFDSLPVLAEGKGRAVGMV